MRVLFWSLALFTGAFLFQLIIWKIRLPDRQSKTLLQIFCCIFLGGLFTIWFAGLVFQPLDIIPPQGLSEYLHVSLFFISFTFAYLITYSAIEVDSPSLIMVLAIQKAGENGLTKEEFEQSNTDDILTLPRINDLAHDKIAYLQGDKYRLTPKGFLLARIFNSYRKVLNLTAQGG
jgi:hypothetical protein